MPGKPSPAGRVFIGLIRLYQRFISPFIGPRCRFYPTCSAYAVEAIRKRGVIRGSIKAIWRIMRCNPLCQGGHDPVDKPPDDGPAMTQKKPTQPR
jgi:uncharacterized protein